MITKDEQLKNKANFISDNGKIYLVKCQQCNRENYAPAVAYGQCVWCGWSEGVENDNSKNL